MRRTGQSRIAAILLLTLLIGVAGPSWAGCAACAAVKGCARPGCHDAPKVASPCCGGNEEKAAASCCGRSVAPLGAALLAPGPSEVMAGNPLSSAAAPALHQMMNAVPVRLVKIPLPRDGVGLYTLHAALLI